MEPSPTKLHGSRSVTFSSANLWDRVTRQQDLSRRIARLVASRKMPAEDYLAKHKGKQNIKPNLVKHRASSSALAGGEASSQSTPAPAPRRIDESDEAPSLSSFTSPLSRLSRATSFAQAQNYSTPKIIPDTSGDDTTDLPGTLKPTTAVDVDRRQGAGETSIVQTSPSDMVPPQGNKHQPMNDVERSSADLPSRGIHIPSRTSSSKAVRKALNRVLSPGRGRSSKSKSTPSHHSPDSTTARTVASSSASIITYETPASSIEPPQLHDKGPSEAHERLEPVTEDDPDSFDLLPADRETGDGTPRYSLEDRSELLFSKEHLRAIFADSKLLHRFTAFLTSTRPKSIPLLIYYLDAIKAIHAINYANAIAEALDPIDAHEFTEHAARPTVNGVLEEKAAAAFDVLVREDLPAFVTHTFIKIATAAITRRVVGTLPADVEESEGLAEVFCFTDMSRPDNPIIFASEEFHRTTQYGVSYAIGRNCRFLQGPRTNKNSVNRLRATVKQGKELSEVFLNYRRDGSPFMNLLMMAPLYDSRGTLRYFIGAQIDISGLVKDCTDLEGLQKLVAKQEGKTLEEETNKDEFQELAEMFNDSELESVRRFGGRMHREDDNESENESRRGRSGQKRPRMLLHDSGDDSSKQKTSSIPETINGKLEGVYQHYLLLRPAPSLRILFTSPTLRIPGILQSPFLDRIGGSVRVRSSLAAALAEGQGVTAKVKWLTNPRASDSEGRTRWVHATPLLDANGKVGVWMVLLIDEDDPANRLPRTVRKFKPAPPVDPPAITNSPRRSSLNHRRTSSPTNSDTNDIMKTVPPTVDSDAEYDSSYDSINDDYDSAPAPRIRTVPRHQPYLKSTKTPSSHHNSGVNSPALRSSPPPPIPRHNNAQYSPHGANRASSTTVIHTGPAADPLREHSLYPEKDAAPAPPAKDHVRITSPSSTGANTPAREKRNFFDRFTGDGIGKKGNGSVDSVAL